MKKLSTDSISHVRKKAREKGGSGRVKGCGEGQHLLYWFKSNLRRDFQVDLGVRRIEDRQAASKGSALGLRSNFRQPGEDFGMTFRMGEARQPSEGTLMDDLQRASVFKRGSCFGRTRTSASKRRTYFFIVNGPRCTLLLYHTSQGNERRRDTMRHGKKPTRKQKIRLGQAGLSPENWLVVREAQTGELVILHKHTDRIRVVPAIGG